MSQMNAVANWRNSTCGGRHSYLPPKVPTPIFSPAVAEYGSNTCRPFPNPRDGQRHHQHTASEIFLVEEQPSWLDDLLDEPETPVKKATHRRSSSDSFAYVDMANVAFHVDSLPPGRPVDEKLASFSSYRELNGMDQCRSIQYASYSADMQMQDRMHKNRMKTPNGAIYFSHSSNRDKTPYHKKGSTRCTDDSVVVPSNDLVERETAHDSQNSLEKKEGPHTKLSLPENDQKRVKQQFAQRSRVRKLQYIAELERSVQALQVEGSEVSAELQFLDQQNLILSLENKALKQRLENLAQEQLLKRFQQDMLEREIARLRTLCQQQRQQNISSSFRARSNSSDLDIHFANLSLSHRETNSGLDIVTGPIHT